MSGAMLAIVVSRTGGPQVLEPTEVGMPEPGRGEALVCVHVAGVNFIDTYYRSGTYTAKLPFIPGQEAAGIVLRSVDTEIPAGSRVCWATSQGAYAEYAVVPASALVPIPAGVSDHMAAAALMQGMAAHYLTSTTYPVQKGDVAVVHAAAGGLGQMLVRLISHLGAIVIGTVSTQAKAAAALAAGASHVVVRSAGDLVEAVRALNGEGAHVVYDSIGAATFDASLACLRPRGMLVLCGASSGPVPAFDLSRLRNGSIYLTRPSLGDHIREREHLLRRSGEVFALLEAGVLTPSVHATFPLPDAREAHRELEGGATSGKLLLQVLDNDRPGNGSRSASF